MADAKKKLHAIQELVSTEEAYARDLRDIQRGYIDAIPDSLLSPEEKYAIFGNWKQLVTFHEKFAVQLKTEFERSPQTIARCFLGVNFIPLYTRPCCYHDRQLSILAHRQESDSQLAALLHTCQESLGHRLPLKDYLLTPVQRIMRYHLLLDEQVKRTGDEETGKALLLEAHASMKDVARSLNDRRRAVQVQDLMLGSVWLTRTKPLHERIVGLTVDFAELGQLLAFIPEANLLIEGKQGKHSHRMVLCFRSGIISCKERENNMLSVKAEYNLATCRLRLLDAHRFCVVIKDGGNDWDTYHVANLDCKALLSDIYPSEADASDGALSPNTRRHRILGNVLKPSSRDRVFSTGKSKTNLMVPDASPPKTPRVHLASDEGSAESVVDDDASEPDVDTWMADLLVEQGSPSEFLSVQRILRSKLMALDAKVKLLTQELQMAVADKEHKDNDADPAHERHSVHFLHGALIAERLHVQELRSKLEEREVQAKDAQQRANEATRMLSAMQTTVEEQAAQVKSLLATIEDKDTQVKKLSQDVDAKTKKIEQSQQACDHAQNQYRNTAHRFDTLQAAHEGLQREHEAVKKQAEEAQARLAVLEKKLLKQQAQFSAELDQSHGSATAAGSDRRRHTFSLSGRRSRRSRRKRHEDQQQQQQQQQPGASSASTAAPTGESKRSMSGVFSTIRKKSLTFLRRKKGSGNTALVDAGVEFMATIKDEAIRTEGSVIDEMAQKALAAAAVAPPEKAHIYLSLDGFTIMSKGREILCQDRFLNVFGVGRPTEQENKNVIVILQFATDSDAAAKGVVIRCKDSNVFEALFSSVQAAHNFKVLEAGHDRIFIDFSTSSPDMDLSSLEAALQ